MSTPSPSVLRAQRVRLALVALVGLAAIVALGVRVTPDDHPAGSSWAGSQPVGPILTEVMASNATTLVDEHGDRSDWIEVHNPTDHAIDLAGYHLTDDPARPTRWSFPTQVLAPGGFLLVHASGRDLTDPAGELHTDFRLARDGEPVLLVASDGRTVADRLPGVAVGRDVSFGRHHDDPTRTCFFGVPTPGAANTPTCFDDDTLGRPTLSVGSRFHDRPFTVEITGPRPDLPIVYTLDGSYPDPVDNAARTHLYRGPVTVDGTAGADSDGPALSSIDPTIPGLFDDWSPPAEPVQTATVLRARPVDGAETVATYLVGPELRREGLAVVSLVTDPAALFDHDTGIYVPGRLAEEHLADPAADHDLGWRTPANYAQRGRDWERPSVGDRRDGVWLEHCPPEGPCRQHSIGLRVHGTSSRAQPQKSLRLYARDDHGTPAFTAPLLGPDGPTGHQRLLLRSSGNDWDGLLLVDAFLQSLMGELAVDTQAAEPVVVFVNGEYWGIHNVRERYDAAYLQLVHGVDADEVVLLDQWLEVTAGTPGADQPFRALLAAAADAAPGDHALRARIEREVDVDSFLDHVIAHVFVANEDWPNNNVRLWRDPAGTGDPSEGVRDGRWRWMVMDLDQMGGTRGRYDPGHDVFTGRLRPSDDPDAERGYPLLFHRLLAYDDLRERFANRFTDVLNTSFAPEHTLAELAATAARLRPELPLHRARWWPGEDAERWEAELAQLETFLAERPTRQRERLAALIGVDGTATLTVATDATAGRLRVNTIDVAPETPGLTRADRFEGVYLTEVAITITATSQPGARFLGWEGLPEDAVTVSEGPSGGVVRVRLQEDTEVAAVFARR